MVNESIVGTLVNISIGGTTYPAKTSSRFEGSYETQKDSVPGGLLKTVGNRDAILDAVIFIEIGDIARLNTANTAGSDGVLPDQAVSIIYKDGKGGTATISGTGILTDLVIADEGEEAKLTAEIHVEFNTAITVR